MTYTLESDGKVLEALTKFPTYERVIHEVTWEGCKRIVKELSYIMVGIKQHEAVNLEAALSLKLII
jgi:hypothetical protein